MAFDKDFVVKNGIQVNENLIYANSDTKKVGIGTTQADKKLVIIGDVEASESLSVGTTVTAERGVFAGILTANDGFDVGIGGTVVSVTTLDKKIGIGSTSPVYTLDLYGPVSTGITAAFIFGDLEVTGNIKATELSGQIAAGGTVAFTNVTVDKTLNANNTEVFTLFRVEEFNSTQFRFLAGGDPVSIGFTENKINPEISLLRGHNYKFDVDSGGFPFYIKTEPTADLDNQYNDGVEGNGTQVGFVTFKVPFNAPNELFYQASNVAGMGGRIIVNSDGKNLKVGFLTVTDTADIKNLEVEFLNVTGIGTIKNIVSDDFSVSSGIVTALQFVGVSTGANRVEVREKNDNVTYKVTFTDDLSVNSNYQFTYVDGDSLTYNPSTNILACSRFVGNVSGVSTGADNVNIDQVNGNNTYQIVFTNTNASDYERLYIDSNNTSLTYNPSSNTLDVPNITATSVNATSFTGDLSGTATNANFVKVDEKGNNVNYQVVFNDNQGSDYERLYIDSESGKFIYNPSTNTLTVDNLTADTINANNINATVTGTIDNATNVNLRPRNEVNAVHYVTFGTAVSGNQRLNTDTGLTYNPATNTLTANFAGLSGSSSKVNIAESNVNEEFQILFSKNQATGAQTPLIDSVSGEFTYNPNTNVFRAGNIVGNGSGLTNLNASKLSSGIVNNALLTKASTTVQGIVRLNDSANSTSSTLAASSKAVDNVRQIAANASNLTTGKVNNALLTKASTSVQGIVRLSNLINGTSTTKAATEFALSQVRELIDSGVIDPTTLPEASLNNKGIVQLSIATNSDNTSLAATPKSINDLRKIAADAKNLTSGIVNNGRLTKATTNVAGIVRLSNATNGDSTTRAATEFALNQVRLLINTGGVDFPNASLTQRGIVQLSNSTNTDSNILAATPTAVNNLRKIAADAKNLTTGIVNNGRLNKATTNVAGIVKLSNATNGDSKSLAATEFALNQVRLLINTGGVDFPDASLSQKGIVQLSNSTNTDSNTLAATPTAVNNLRKIAANATNLTSGEVSRALLPKAGLSSRGIVQTSNSTNVDDNDVAASLTAVNNLRKIAANATNLTSGTVSRALLPKASTTQRGITQLSNKINGTDTNQAATEFALNKVRELIDSGVVDPTTLPVASLNNQGIVQLDDSTNSNNITRAATPSAVNGVRLIASDADNLTSGTVSRALLPKASTTARGIVQLSNSINGTDTNQAATEFALNKVRELIPTEFLAPDASLTQKGIVQLSNATSTNDNTKAATPTAINDLRKIAANASNLTSGEVSRALLPKAGLSSRGIVQTGNSTNVDDNDTAASLTAVNNLRKIAANAINLIEGTVNVARLPKAATNARGIVQLSNSIDGDSTSKAATEFALSQVKNLIPNIVLNNASLTQRGIVQLSNSTNTDSNTLAATPTAVNNLRKIAANATNLTSGTVSRTLLPKAGLSARGIVQLSNSIDGDSTSKAATEFALSQVKNLIPNIVLNNASLTQRGIVQLSNATGNNDNTKAATPTAVNSVRKIAANATNLTSGKVNSSLLPNAATNTRGIVQLNNAINSTDTSTAATPAAVNDARLAAKNASNLNSGTVGRGLLPSATTGAKGVTQLYSTFPPTSKSNSIAATADLVRKVYDSAQQQIPSGSIMLFYQGSAPSGWTKITSQNNKAIRVVSGTGGGGGGNNTFTATFANKNVPLPKHNHTASSGNNDANHRHEGSTDNGGTHSHSIFDLGHTHFIANSTGAVSSPNSKQKLNSTTAAGSQGFGGTGATNEKRDYVLEKSSSSNANVGLTSKVKTDITVTTNNSAHKHTYKTGTNLVNHKHPITVNNAGSTVAQMDMRVQYINVIICRKN